MYNVRDKEKKVGMTDRTAVTGSGKKDSMIEERIYYDYFYYILVFVGVGGWM